MFGGSPSGAYRCSTCSLNFKNPGRCLSCEGETEYMSNAKPTEDLEEELARRKRAAVLRDPDEQLFIWRRNTLVEAGCPWDYAVKFAKDREFELHKTAGLFKNAIQMHGEMRGRDLALDILL